MYQHPEWKKYHEMMTAAKIGPVTIHRGWDLLMQGFEEQGELYLIDRGSRPSNQYFDAFARLMEDELRFKPNTSLALWSGGYDVSRYAQSKGHTPLEQTKIGYVLDHLEFHKNWKLQAALWNTVSRAFVRNPSLNVHLFLRGWDTNSVLIRQEVPGLHALKATGINLNLRWHALYTDEKNVTKEVSARGDLLQNYEFTQRDLCVAALSKYLLYINSDPANRAAKELKDRLELKQWATKTWKSIGR